MRKVPRESGKSCSPAAAASVARVLSFDSWDDLDPGVKKFVLEGDGSLLARDRILCDDPRR